MRRILLLVPDRQSRLVILSPAECRVVSGLITAATPKEIAFSLDMYHSTFAEHLARIMSAFNLHTRAQLFRFTLTHPELMAGYAVEPVMHLDDCICLAPYCTAVRTARQLVMEAALSPLKKAGLPYHGQLD